MNKKVIFVHGEKGGSGKSVVSSVIVDYYINNKDYNILLIEGDNSTPDVGRRYAECDRVNCVQTSLGGDDSTNAVSNIINFVDNDDYDRVIINLPSRASDTLDPLAHDLIKPAFEMLEFEIVVLFVIAEKIDSPIQAVESLKNGLVNIADKRIAVLNEKSNALSVEKYVWTTEPTAGRAAWLKSGGQEVYLSHLHQRVMTQTEAGAYSDYLNQLNIAERILLKRWLNDAHKIGDMIEADESIEETEEVEDAA